MWIQRQRGGLATEMRRLWRGVLPRLPEHSTSSVLRLVPFRLSQELVHVTLPGLMGAKKLEPQGL